MDKTKSKLMKFLKEFGNMDGMSRIEREICMKQWNELILYGRVITKRSDYNLKGK